MPQVVVEGATIQCNHGGIARLPGGDNRLQVSNKSAVIAGQEVGISFEKGTPNVVIPCLHQTKSSPPVLSPCTATVAATDGVSTLLVIGGAGVLLNNATGKTINADPAEQALLKWTVVDAGQTLLSVDN